MEYRDMMQQNDDNLGWCKPLSWEDGRVVLAVNEGAVSGIQVDGASIEITPENIKAIAQRINSEYGEYSDCGDTEIILDCEDEAEELPCRLCPWFYSCDAMDEEIEEDPEYIED